jgi:hypothetical protein
MHASTDRIGAHQLTDSPELADIILFKCDQPWCAFPGVYVNMPRRRFVPVHQRPWTSTGRA